MCPVLCSGNGDYEDGVCRCFPGWKGIECQLRSNECEVADCNGHGKCVNGICICARGFTGKDCKQGKLKIIFIYFCKCVFLFFIFKCLVMV